MRKSRFIPIIFILAIVLGCKGEGKDPTEQPKQLLTDVVGMLDAHDYEGCLRYVDAGCELDSSQTAILLLAMKQYQERQEQRKGSVKQVEIVDAKLTTDTLCTVFCKLFFADGTEEVSSQKLVKSDGEWKIRLRN